MTRDQDPRIPDGDEPLVQVGPGILMQSFVEKTLKNGLTVGIHVMSCHVMSCYAMSCHVMPCHVMSCHVMSCHVMSCCLTHPTLYFDRILGWLLRTVAKPWSCVKLGPKMDSPTSK